MSQVEQYNPPPNPAKETDSRFNDYSARFGDECWELDALPPEAIHTLIEDAILKIRDETKWQAMLQQETDDKRMLDAIIEELGEQTDVNSDS